MKLPVDEFPFFCKKREGISKVGSNQTNTIDF